PDRLVIAGEGTGAVAVPQPVLWRPVIPSGRPRVRLDRRPGTDRGPFVLSSQLGIVRGPCSGGRQAPSMSVAEVLRCDCPFDASIPAQPMGVTVRRRPSGDLRLDLGEFPLDLPPPRPVLGLEHGVAGRPPEIVVAQPPDPPGPDLP